MSVAEVVNQLCPSDRTPAGVSAAVERGLREAKHSIMHGWLKAGAALILCDSYLLWQKAGAKSLADYMEGEYGISKSYGYAAMDALRLIHKFLPLNEEIIMGIEIGRMNKMLPILKKLPDEESIELLQKAKDLPSEAFEDEVRELKGKVPRDKCEHLECEPIQLKKCKLCGKVMKNENQC